MLPARGRLRTTDKLLAGLLAAVVLLVAAVAALAAVIWVRTEPAHAPSGPTRSVVVYVSALQAAGTAALVDASGVSTAQLDDAFDLSSTKWTRDVAAGASIEVDLLVTSLHQDDDGTIGSLSCTISDDTGTPAEGRVGTEGTHAVCRWTNNGG